MDESIRILVDGGMATAGPPLGPALGPLGVNAAKVVEEINKKTGEFRGMKIPVEVVVNTDTKAFEVKVGTPPTSALIIKALGLEKGGGSVEPVGDLSFMQLTEIAGKKTGSLLANDIKAAIKEVAGTCQSLSVTIEGRKPKDLIKEIADGRFDDVIAGKTTKIPEMIVQAKKIKIVGITKEEPEPEEKPAEEGKEKAEEKKPGEAAAKEKGEGKRPEGKKPGEAPAKAPAKEKK